MDVGSKFDRAELPFDDDESQLGKKRGRGDDGGDEGDGGLGVTEGATTTRSPKVYSVFPFWIEASTPIINLYGDGEVTGDYEDSFKYDDDHDLKRVTYYDYDRYESLSPTQVPMPAADAGGSADPKDTTLVHPYVTHTPFTPSTKVQTPLETSTEKPIDIVKDKSSSGRSTLTTLSPTTTWHTTTTKRRIGKTSTTLASPKPTWSASTFSARKSTLMASVSHKWPNQTPEISKSATKNSASSAASAPSNPTVAPTTAGVAIKSSTEGNREHAAKVAGGGERDDHVASTASPPHALNEAYDYGEKEYGVNEGSLESDLLKLLDKLARRYNESVEGVSEEEQRTNHS